MADLVSTRPVSPRPPTRPKPLPRPKAGADTDPLAVEVCERLALYGLDDPFIPVLTTPTGMQIPVDELRLYSDAPISIESGYAPVPDRRAA